MSNPWDWFNNNELHERFRIRLREREVIAECARLFKNHPELLDRWAEYKK